MTRIIFSSNSGNTPTGYGNQTKYAVKGIQSLGYPIAVHAWWGLQGGPVVIDGIQHYPGQFDSYGNDAAAHVCQQFKADLLITLIDLWVMDPALGHMGGVRWAPWFPIDHAGPIPPIIAQRFPHAHRLLVYSRFAEREVKAYENGRYAEKVRYIPHGIATDVYRPASDPERAAFRRKFYPDWPADAFVVGMVAANKGYPSRKSFPEAMEAFALLAQAHPEARLYLHSYPGAEMKGIPLIEMAQHFGIADRLRIANTKMLMGGDYSDEVMREIYCSMDVLLAPSQGEGFGIPIVEAQSCGVSVIVNDHSAMSELVGCGWRVKPLRLQPSLIWGKFAEADVVGVHHALEECIRRPQGPHWAAAARQFAMGYSWPLVLRDYWAPFLAEMDGNRRALAQELEALRAG